MLFTFYISLFKYSSFGEADVHSDVQGASPGVVIVVGHALPRLLDLGTRPCHLVSVDVNLLERGGKGGREGRRRRETRERKGARAGKVREDRGRGSNCCELSHDTLRGLQVAFAYMTRDGQYFSSIVKIS